MEVNTVLYGIVSVGIYCNSVSVKVAIKAYNSPATCLSLLYIII